MMTQSVHVKGQKSIIEWTGVFAEQLLTNQNGDIKQSCALIRIVART